ncbi:MULTISPECIES: class F sortase [unclassified Streptomyces]|uniref:class F sortase n=1 Tax=unclassified Streptomyces TaxID=2593676 RepID=UPI0033B1D95A|nr:class F sortase [Streptomyces sp. NBC_01653]WTC84455.1 class F sortase [Streptomyces sp. NBC_01653]WTD86412.1 class F sortase [Streptomyces sp. NBC_01637]WTD94112.1 class F sortase [Streptomyces sp. NBC_01637]WTF25012.1 class F sortase [Streptomyces sp. NBC_01602]
MPRTHHRLRRSAAHPTHVCLALVLALAPLTGCMTHAAQEPAHAPSHRSATTPPSRSSVTPRAEQPAAPTQVAIPSIGVTSSLMRLGLNADGTVEVPPAEKGMTAGWYTGGAIPGERGAAVVIGHNDTRFGRAVFHDLKKIGKGADIVIRNERGQVAHFTVTGTESVSKKAFPTKKVYGATDDRVLRLITCDGAFDAQGHPVDNLIVYATLR